MKTIINIILLFGLMSQLHGQGTISMSSIGKGVISLNNVPVGAGEAVVYLANLEGELISKPVNILGSGVFSAGTEVLNGYSGTVKLKLGVVYSVMPDTVIYSEPFTVRLGGSGVPPAPPAPLPRVSVNLNVDIDIPEPPEPERTWPIRTDSWVSIDPQNSAKFYRADNLQILSIKEDTILLRFNGSLEVSESSDGPWVLVE